MNDIRPRADRAERLKDTLHREGPGWDAVRRSETTEDVEQQIRRHPTANERFLLGLLDEARETLARTEDGWRRTNAECIKHWNRADKAEADLRFLRDQGIGCE